MKTIKKRVRDNATPQFQIPTYLNGFAHTHVYREEDDDFEENSV